MKVNLPVTDHELQFEDDILIVSRTDLKGCILAVNHDFIRISGFSEAELVGQSHNIVRHPDMPPAAFADFWATLKSGKPWVGLVKNRCKNGDFYWVEANATPILESGQMVGFLSVRVKPSRAKVEQADALYRAMREGHATHLTVREGRIVKKGWLQRLNFFRRIHERATMRTKFGLIGLVLFIPLLLSLSLLVIDLKQGADDAKLERVGLAYHQQLRQLLPELQKHRGISALASAGNADAARKLTSIDTQIASVMKAVDEQAKRFADPDIDEAWRKIHAEWTALAGESSKLSADQDFARQTQIIDGVVQMMSGVANRFGLELDPYAASHHIVTAAVVHAPDLAESVARARGFGVAAIARGTLDTPTRATLLKLLAASALNRAAIGSSAKHATEARPDLQINLGHLTGTLDDALIKFSDLAEQKVIAPAKPEINGPDYFAAGTAAVDASYAFYDKSVEMLDSLLVERIAVQTQRTYLLLSLTLICFGSGVVIAWLFMRYTSHSLRVALDRFWEISSGNFKGQVHISTDDEIGQVMRGLKAMQIKLGFDINDSRERANEALRLKIGLDSTTTNVMIADNDRNIIYLNPAVLAMLRKTQTEIRKEIPHFDVEKLLGSSIDIFHKDPSHQARLLSSFTKVHQATVKIGGCTFFLSANPVINERGERLGSIVEWLDRTAEVAVEREVNDIVSAAAAGDFSQRINESDKHGFFKALAEGINKLVTTTDAGLKDITRVLAALAKGDLTERINADYQGTFGDLKNYSNDTVRSLEQMLRHIREASETIHAASSEIASGNTDLSSRTEEQAASLEETAASMEELTSTVKQNAQNARQANKLADGASEVATRGGDVVGKVVVTMGEINDSARKIVDIIGVIDGIAFQTNILALNAAVEAARAGEQGRGFAVVAGEVRNLAQRSAAAAKEIKLLINDSVEKVESGNRLVEQAGKTMEEVVTSIKRVTDIMNEISAASLEQSNGIEQVGTAVAQMDETTQQNAALVEEAAASAEALSGQAATMLSIVRRFRLDDAVVSEASDAAPPSLVQADVPALPKPGRATRGPVLSRKTLGAKPASLPPAVAAGEDGDQDDDWSEF